ncbi:MAG: helix-hairpin-helix domain-containing protein [Christensenellales bacterium]
MGELLKIPGVGVKIQEALIRLGYPTIASLRDADPQEMYRRDCEMRGMLIDRCLLYVYRCAVYYAGTPNPDSENLKWWHWKDEKQPASSDGKKTDNHQ